MFKSTIFSLALLFSTIFLLGPANAEDRNPIDSAIAALEAEIAYERAIDSSIEALYAGKGPRMAILEDSTTLEFFFLGNTKEDMQFHRDMVDAWINDLNPDSIDYKDGETQFSLKAAIDFYTNQFEISVATARRAIESGTADDLFEYTQAFHNAYMIGKFIKGHPILSKLNFYFMDISNEKYFVFTCGDLFYEAQNSVLNGWTESWVKNLKFADRSEDEEAMKVAVRQSLYMSLINETLRGIVQDLMVFQELSYSWDLMGNVKISDAYKQKVNDLQNHVIRAKDENSWLWDFVFGEDYHAKVVKRNKLLEEAGEFFIDKNTREFKLLSLKVQKEDEFFNSEATKKTE